MGWLLGSLEYHWHIARARGKMGSGKRVCGSISLPKGVCGLLIDTGSPRTILRNALLSLHSLSR